MTITFIGHGSVVLVTACVFADFGNKVWVVGHTKEKLERLKNGDPIIYEPGLKELLEKNLKAKRIFFTDSYENAIPESDIVFIAVGTPPKETGEADLTTVFEVAEKIAKHLKDGVTVLSCKSTVPVGTNNKVEGIVAKLKGKKAEVLIASCPEFLREGTGIYDTLNPDRVVIGSDSKKAVSMLLELHKPINGKRIVTNLASAELIKYASNAMLATKISFANFISFYCEKTGADVERVMDAVGLDNRIGRAFLYPGIGYGGSCLPKDVKALIDNGKSMGIDTSLLQKVEEINLTAQQNFLQRILSKISKGKIAIWGLAFKPNTDDIRFAPSLYLLQALLDKGFKLSVHDPEAMRNIKAKFSDTIEYVNDPYDALRNADALCILTEWNEFKQIDLEKVKEQLKNPLIFDGRNIYDPVKMDKLGFSYFGVGRNV